jgi:hypothetical protein
MSSHTPGPWVHGKDQGQVGSIELPDGTVIGQSQALVGDFTRVKREANAALMAAAPELLYALKLCSSILAGENLSKSALVRALEASRAAMIKAGCTP